MRAVTWPSRTGSCLLAWITAAGLWALGGTANAEIEPLGSVICVNQTTTGRQAHASLASDSFGNVWAAWIDIGSTSSAIKIRKFSPSGSPLTDEITVATLSGNPFSTYYTDSGSSNYPRIAVTDDGRVVVAGRAASSALPPTYTIHFTPHCYATYTSSGAPLVNWTCPSSLRTADLNQVPTLAVSPVSGRFAVVSASGCCTFGNSSSLTAGLGDLDVNNGAIDAASYLGINQSNVAGTGSPYGSNGNGSAAVGVTENDVFAFAYPTGTSNYKMVLRTYNAANGTLSQSETQVNSSVVGGTQNFGALWGDAWGWQPQISVARTGNALITYFGGRTLKARVYNVANNPPTPVTAEFELANRDTATGLERIFLSDTGVTTNGSGTQLRDTRRHGAAISPDGTKVIATWPSTTTELGTEVVAATYDISTGTPALLGCRRFASEPVNGDQLQPEVTFINNNTAAIAYEGVTSCEPTSPSSGVVMSYFNVRSTPPQPPSSLTASLGQRTDEINLSFNGTEAMHEVTLRYNGAVVSQDLISGTTKQFTGLCSGTYTVEVSGKNLCDQSSSTVASNPVNVTAMAATPECKSAAIALDSSGQATISNDTVYAAGALPCGTNSLSQSTFTCANLGANNVTLAITDSYGTSVTCDGTVTIVDNLSPVAKAKNVTIAPGPTGTVTLTPEQVNDASTDNCGITSMTVTPNTFGCADLGGHTVTLTVTDSSGNTSSATATVTVAPVAATSCFATVNLPLTQPNNQNRIVTISDVSAGIAACPGISTEVMSKGYFDGNWTTTTTNLNTGTNASSNPRYFTLFNNKLWFVADLPSVTGGLFVYDGTSAPTLFQPTGSSLGLVSSLTVMGNALYFAGWGQVNGVQKGLELWKTEGTLATTSLVRDINTSSSSQSGYSLANSNGNLYNNPNGFAVFTNTQGPALYFAAYTPANNVELWKSDGSEAGTVLLADIIVPTSLGSSPGNFTVVGSTLYFTATYLNASNYNQGTELWKTDGTTAGTMLVSDIYPGNFNSASPAYLTALGNTLYFTAYDGTGTHLWKSQGTAATTTKVLSSGGSPIFVVNQPKALNGVLYFAAQVGGGSELWRTDGTQAGTYMVKDIYPGTTNASAPDYLTVFQNKLYFVANDGTNGAELWRSDGTEAGTSMVVNFLPGSAGLTPSKLAAVGDFLYFVGTNGAGNTEPYAFDGTTVKLVKEIFAGGTGSSPSSFTAFLDMVIYQATPSTSVGAEFTSSSLPSKTQVLTLADIGQTKQVVLVATDTAGGKSTCVSNVVVCGPKTTLNGLAHITQPCGQAFNDPGAVSTNQCGATLTTITTGSVNAAVPGIYTLTYSAVDGYGNVATPVTRTVEIVSTGQPVITLNGNDPLNVACGATYTEPGATAVDGCGNNVLPGAINITHNIVSGAPGTYSVYYNYTDGSGNAAAQVTRIVNISGADSLPPSISGVGGNLSIACGATPSFSQPAASDACDPNPSLTYNDTTTSGNCAQDYSVTRTWTATDSGNLTSTASQTITVSDTAGPTIGVAPSTQVSVGCASSVPPVDTSALSATDACDPSPTVSHFSDVPSAQTCADRFTLTRTYRATDACGNVTPFVQTITVNDQSPPSVTCPSNQTLECGSASNPPQTGSASGTDTCGGAVSVTYSDTATAAGCAGAAGVARSWTAADVCGNTAACTQSISFTDTTAPMITNHPAANVAVGCAFELPAASTSALSAIDNCGGNVTITHAGDQSTPGTCANRFSLTRTYNASDACNNQSSFVQTLHVNDQTGPTIVCPSNQQLACGASTDPAQTGSATAIDACGGSVTITHSDAATSPSCTGLPGIARTWTATDECGNQSTCVQQIEFADVTPPSIVNGPPINVSLTCAADVPEANDGLVTASDNCGGTPIITHAVNEPVSGLSCDNRFTRTRTYVATDSCGNSTQLTQTFVVDDQTAPQITCPSNQALACGASTAPSETGTATATDGCGGSPTIAYEDESIDANCTGREGIARTWTATDACGNQSTCVQELTYVDSTPPMIGAPGANQTIEAPGSPVFTAPTATDGCTTDPEIVLVSDVTTQASCAGTYSRTRTWKAVDACGNESAHVQQTISVADTTAPEFTCPSDIVLGCSTERLVPVTYSVTDASDRVDDSPQIVFSPPSGSGFPVGKTDVEATVSDCSGNKRVCTFAVRRAQLDFEGFDPPLGGADATGGTFTDPLRLSKLTSTTPIKFRASCEGVPVTTGEHKLLLARYIDATSFDTPIVAVATDSATTDNLFRRTDSAWHFNLDHLASGMLIGVWELRAILSDGSQHRAAIQLR